MHPLAPTTAFNSVELILKKIPVGATMFGRINKAAYPDPLGYGFNPSRFSDPQVIDPGKQFGVVYLGSELDVCFLEAVLRDQRNGKIGDYPLPMSEFTSRTYAQIFNEHPLKLIDLTGDKKVRMGIPTDVTNASDQELGRLWSEAIFLHPAAVDGIFYESRLCRKRNLAIFDRAVGKLACAMNVPLLKALGLASVITRYKVAIVP